MTSKTPHADPIITPELVKQHGLTPEEFDRIKKILGRDPNFTELGIFSVMWSEHCSYKNTRRELKKFPTTGPNIIIQAPSSLSKAPRLASAVSFATFLRWARAQSFV